MHMACLFGILRAIFEEVMSSKSEGGAFVPYQWIIPTPVVSPVRRLSKVYFIPNGVNKSAYAFRFNLTSLSLLFWLLLVLFLMYTFR